MERRAAREISLTDREKIQQEFFADERKANEERHGGVYEKDPFYWGLFTSEQKAQVQRALARKEKRLIQQAATIEEAETEEV